MSSSFSPPPLKEGHVPATSASTAVKVSLNGVREGYQASVSSSPSLAPSEDERSSSLPSPTVTSSLVATDSIQVPRTPLPVRTVDLLQMVDLFYEDFCRIVELHSRSKEVQNNSALNSCSPESTKEERLCCSSESKAANPILEVTMMQECLLRWQSRVVSLQQGIRSKIEQTARFALVHQLKKEISERHHAITKIESVLQSLRQQ